MIKFDTDKIEKELKKISKENGIRSDVGTIQIIVNNCLMYNYLCDELEKGDDSKIYTIYQISLSIFKMIADYNVLPTKKKTEPKKVDKFMDMIGKVERRTK